jgi:hypothetical protein
MDEPIVEELKKLQIESDLASLEALHQDFDLARTLGAGCGPEMAAGIGEEAAQKGPGEIAAVIMHQGMAQIVQRLAQYDVFGVGGFGLVPYRLGHRFLTGWTCPARLLYRRKEAGI